MTSSRTGKMDAPMVNVFLGAETGVLKGNFIQIAGADSGFPVRGRQHMTLPNFPLNCMKLKKNWAGGDLGAPLSIRSAT